MKVTLPPRQTLADVAVGDEVAISGVRFRVLHRDDVSGISPGMTPVLDPATHRISRIHNGAPTGEPTVNLASVEFGQPFSFEGICYFKTRLTEGRSPDEFVCVDLVNSYARALPASAKVVVEDLEVRPTGSIPGRQTRVGELEQGTPLYYKGEVWLVKEDEPDKYGELRLERGGDVSYVDADEVVLRID